MLDASPNRSIEASLDPLLRGRLRIWQPTRGQRVTLDPLLLADFAARTPPTRILDLGCGTGVIAVACLVGTAATGVGVELQADLAELARRNVEENGLAGRLDIVCGDLRAARELGAFDLVVANPPYHDGRGRPPPDAERALARHDLACTLPDVAAAATRHLAPKGRVCLVYPAERLADVFAAFAVRSLRFVHSIAGEPARRVLVEAAPAWRGGVTVLAPLVVHGDDRRTYTSEAARILGDAA